MGVGGVLSDAAVGMGVGRVCDVVGLGLDMGSLSLCVGGSAKYVSTRGLGETEGPERRSLSVAVGTGGPGRVLFIFEANSDSTAAIGGSSEALGISADRSLVRLPTSAAILSRSSTRSLLGRDFCVIRSVAYDCFGDNTGRGEWTTPSEVGDRDTVRVSRGCGGTGKFLPPPDGIGIGIDELTGRGYRWDRGDTERLREDPRRWCVILDALSPLPSSASTGICIAPAGSGRRDCCAAVAGSPTGSA